MPRSTSPSPESAGVPAVRPYLIVGDASAAIDFYTLVFDAVEVERHTTPAGGVGHAKLAFGDTILELGEHHDAAKREPQAVPRVGLRLYVLDVDETYERAISGGADGDPPSDRPGQGVRGATVYDPFGLTWWLATPRA